jgi:hypothetical protein
MRKTKNWLKILVIVPAVFLLFSCNPVEDESRSNSILLIVRVQGADVEKNEADFLQSDVVVFDQDSGESTVAADSAGVTFTAETLDPAPWLGTSIYQDIVVTDYVVSYTRSDGKNQEGVDVPYSFDGSLNARIEIGGQTTVNFVIVRAVSKLEPPLVNMATGRGEGELKTTARIDFYGHDTLGHTVTATGYLTVFFANYITEDESSEGEGGN